MYFGVSLLSKKVHVVDKEFVKLFKLNVVLAGVSASVGTIGMVLGLGFWGRLGESVFLGSEIIMMVLTAAWASIKCSDNAFLKR